MDYIAEPLLAGIHAGYVERLSTRALFPQLLDAERAHGSVIRGLAHARRTPPIPDGPFRALPGGMGELAAALTDHLAPGALRTGAAVRALRGTGPYRLHLEGGATLSARQVVLAVPGFAAATLLRPLDAELAELCGGIRHTSSATVALGYPRAAIGHDLRGTGFVVPRVETGLSVMAGTWVSSKWPGRAPAGQSLLRGFVGGARDSAALERTDTELAAAVHGDFARLLGIPRTADTGARLPLAARQPAVRGASRGASRRHRCAGWSGCPGLHLIGASLRGVGIPDCIGAGRRAGMAASAAVGRRAP